MRRPYPVRKCNLFDGRIRDDGCRLTFSQGSHEFSPLASDAAQGIYLVKMQAGTVQKALLMKKAEGGIVSLGAVRSGILAKALVSADSLVVNYANQKIGSVAVRDDAATVDDIVITHKVVSGSIPASSSWNYAVNAFAKTYSATSSWKFYVSSRTWSVSANGTSATVSDTVQNVNLDIVTPSSSSAAYSSSSEAYSSSAVPTSSAAAGSSSSS